MDASPALPLDDASLPDHLRARGIAAASDEIVVGPAGAGNIDWVRRARALGRDASRIVKQARFRAHFVDRIVNLRRENP